MANKVLLAYAVIDFLFAVTGAILLAFTISVQNIDNEAPTNGVEAARDFLYRQFPLTAGLVNGIIVLAIFVISLPGMAASGRAWLKFSGYLTVGSGIFTLVIGLYMWVLTLKTKDEFSVFWSSSASDIQSLMQQSFSCCGFFNSTSPAFVTDTTCPSPASAALVRGCAAPLTSYGNVFVDQLFTAVFGMVGIDAALILANACLLKERAEQARFKYIDEKFGASF